MPGITGIFGQGNNEERNSQIKKMLNCLIHEQFYTSGTYTNEELGIWVGWTCLRDSFSDGMPVWNEKKDVCLIFSGEDFSGSENIGALRAGGHIFDSENACYLVHLYEEKGKAFVKSLNGRFSGVIIDFRGPICFLFNDRYGLNRINYVEKRGSFYFSSEAKSLLQVIPELRQIDLKSLAETYSCGCILQNRTLFSGVSLAPGGSIFSYAPGDDLRKSRYFLPKFWEDQPAMSYEIFYRELKETWIRLLPRYFMGREPMAISLTGGKDSRMIMAWSQIKPGTVPCYTFGSLYRDSRDVKLARKASEISRQTHRVIVVGEDFLKAFSKLAERTVLIAEGTIDVSGAAELYVNSLARLIAPVRVTGNYGQEILRRSIAFRPNPMYDGILQKDFLELLRNASDTYWHEAKGNLLSFVAFKQLPWFHYSRLALELSQLTCRSPFLDNDLVALAYQAPRDVKKCLSVQLRLISEGSPELGKMETDLGIQANEARLMGTLRQLYQLITFKAEYAYDYGMPHWLAKFNQLTRSLHPERLFLGRHKFTHYRLWYRNELSDYIKEILLDPRTKNRPYLDSKGLEKIVLSHITGKANYTAEIHRALTSELLHRQFTD